MAQELKLIPHDDGLLSLIDDPTWSREYPGLQGRRIVAMLAVLFLVMGLVTVGLGAVGFVADIGATAGFSFACTDRTLPTTISDSPAKMEAIDVANSGSEVPMEMMVTPMINGEIPRDKPIFSAPSTNQSEPLSSP